MQVEKGSEIKKMILKAKRKFSKGVGHNFLGPTVKMKKLLIILKYTHPGTKACPLLNPICFISSHYNISKNLSQDFFKI